MKIQVDDVVADFSAENSFFTFPIAKHTMKAVYAVDAEPKIEESS